MKKKILLVMIIGIMAFVLCGCCSHVWEEATCTEPETCSLCDKTKGDPLGHEDSEYGDWEMDTEEWIYYQVKYCERCGEYYDRIDGDRVNSYIEEIKTVSDISNELMNDDLKNIISLFSKGFSDSGLDVANATTYDDEETYIFYLDNIEFLENKCEEGSNSSPRIIYEQNAVSNNGTPSKLYFAFANPRDSNGYDETVEMVEDIAEVLDISDEGLINNDYSSSSPWATGEYATFFFPNLNITLTVSNTDSFVKIEILPME